MERKTAIRPSPGKIVATIVRMIAMRPASIILGEPVGRVRHFFHRKFRKRARTPRVRLDPEKCPENALECALCIRSCPRGVYFVYPAQRKPGEICHVYHMTRAFASRCTGCGTCVEVCPHGALEFR